MTMPSTGTSPNRLATELSPYLRSHASNPVDWSPWGDEAFARAAAEDKPVFLSIGYATCHWCHVMERESFADPALAAELNAVFVPIKVDREERPDVDAVYLRACIALTGSAGWPLTVLLTPDRQPFFAGTYFPPETRRGRIGLRELIARVRDAWRDQRRELVTSAREITAALAAPPLAESAGRIDEAVLREAEAQLAAQHDPRHGGFGGAPKFPTAHHLRFLLRRARRTGDPALLRQARHTLLAMRAGGLWDHVGGGFHRYSTDAAWRVPHFEKMLYDQAMLAHAYLDGFEATGDAILAATARDTLGYVLRDLAVPGGGLGTAEDADSEGEEGRFYLWSLADLNAALPPDLARWAATTFQVTEAGTRPEELGPGQCHLALSGIEALLRTPESPQRLAAARQTLLDVRAHRVRPLFDDKVLTDLNGLALGALARAGRVLGAPELVEAARGVLAFLEKNLLTPEGRLLHRHREGQSGIAGFLDDHAFLVDGLLELHAATQDPEALAAALRIQRAQEAELSEPDGGYALSAGQATELPFRPREHADGALPSGTSMTAHNLLRLARLTGDTAWADRLERLLMALAPEVRRAPTAFTHLLHAVDLLAHDDGVVVVAGAPDAPDTLALLAAAQLPDRLVLLRTPETAVRLAELAPWTAALLPVGGCATAYRCREGRCDLPVTEPARLRIGT